jgi:hypothetical protein
VSICIVSFLSAIILAVLDKKADKHQEGISYLH